jgi:predicted component of type VI protein secretion system
MRRIGAIAVAVTGLAVVAGCGGSSANDKYKSQVKAIDSQLKGSLASINSTSGSDPTAKIQQLQNFFNSAADQFSKTTPPANAKADNAQVVTELRQAATDSGALAPAIQKKDANALRGLVTKLQQDDTALNNTFNKLKSDVGG